MLLVASCAGRQTENAAWRAGRGDLLAIQDWSLQGKLAVNSDQGNASLRVAWTQHRDEFDLILTGPLGQVLARIRGGKGKVTLESPGNEPLISEDPESLIHEIWGWRLPVSQMPFWVRGLPAPDFPHQVDYGADGAQQQLSQLGWQVRYLRFKDGLPVRLELSRSEVKLRLVVKRWQMPISTDDG